MVDFKKLRASKAKPNPVPPREIFHSLPKPAGINDLYASQAEVLDIWHGRRHDRDIVVKLHTGGGKTLVALLMAQSIMNETGLPVLYLAPTNQLVDQVLAKSREYGIAAVPYVKKQPFPTEFEEGKAVLVGAYETLFSGRSRFGVRGSSSQLAQSRNAKSTAACRTAQIRTRANMLSTSRGNSGRPGFAVSRGRCCRRSAGFDRRHLSRMSANVSSLHSLAI
jgi:hypothetical protein